MYTTPSIEIVTIYTESIVCQSKGSTSIDNYNEENLNW